MSLPTSTYGLNTLNKVMLLNSANNKNINKELASAWAMGDIDNSILKNLAFTYKEYLKASNDEMNKIFDNLTVGIRSKLNAYTKKLNMISNGNTSNGDLEAGPSGSEASSKTADAILDFVAAISVFGGDQLDAAEMYQNIVGYVQKYNVPVRTQNPNITIPLTEPIKINFAWGKGGLFNAKQEVWDPINKIVNSLKPDMTRADKDNKEFNGLYKMENLNTIPYRNQTKYLVLKSTVGDIFTDGSKKSFARIANSAVKSLANTGVDGINKTKKEAKVSKILSKASVEGVLSNIALLNPRMLSIAAVKMRNVIIDSLYTLCIAFKPGDISKGTYIFNINDMVGNLGEGYYPLIMLSGVPESISWGFDYTNPDEKGYPMAGYIKIEKLWAVDAFGGNFNLGDSNKDTMVKLMKGGTLEQEEEPNV